MYKIDLDFGVLVGGNMLATKGGYALKRLVKNIPSAGTLLPLTITDFYQDNNYTNKPSSLIDGNTSTNFNPANSLIVTPHDVVVELRRFNVVVKKIRLYDGAGSGSNTQIILVRASNGVEEDIGLFTGSQTNTWVEYFPAADFIASHLILRGSTGAHYGAELEVFGDYIQPTASVYTRPKKALRNMFGINDTVSNLLQGPSNIQRYDAITALGVDNIRVDIAASEIDMGGDVWAYEPTASGWNTKMLFQMLKQDGILGRAVINGQNNTIKATWDAVSKASHLPFTYQNTDSRETVSIYQSAGRQAFVWATIFGANASAPDYTPNGTNTLQKGLDAIFHYEAVDQPDAEWKGIDGYMIGQWLAPMWSMIYDGHKGAYPTCGVKNADPNMKVVHSGLARAATDCLRAVWEWSRTNRGVLPNGQVNLPFDVISFHKYSSTAGLNLFDPTLNVGLPPEIGTMLPVINEFIDFSNRYAEGKEVWLSGWGYDVNGFSPYAAPAIGSKTAEQIRAAWTARSIMEFSANGLDRASYRTLLSVNDSSSERFDSISLLTETFTRRTVGNYWKQLWDNYKDFVFDSRITTGDANVRCLKFKHPTSEAEMYAIWSVEQSTIVDGKPVFTERTGTFNLPLASNPSIKINTFQDGAAFSSTTAQVSGGQYGIAYSSTPVIVEQIPTLVDLDLNATATDNGNNTFTIKFGRNAAQLTNAPVLVAIGSSSVKGVGASVEAETSFVAKLRTWLRTLSPVSATVNRGVSTTDSRFGSPDNSFSQTTPHRNITAALSVNPTMVLVGYPTNDIAVGRTPEQWRDAIVAIFNEARSRGVACFVGSPQPRNAFATADQNLLIQANALMKAAIPAKYYIDSLEFLSQPVTATQTKPAQLKLEYDSNDGLHLNDAGHAYIFDRYRTAMINHFQDLSVMQYELEVAELPQGPFSLLAISTNPTDISITVNRTTAALRYYRVRAKIADNVYSEYSNVVSMHQPNFVGTLEETVQFDFSTVTTTSTGWNTLVAPSSGAAAGTNYTNFVNSNGQSVLGLSLTVTKAFSGAVGGGPATFAGPPSLPTHAVNDMWTILQTSTQPAEFTINGLSQSLVYNIDIVSSFPQSDSHRMTGFYAQNGKASGGQRVSEPGGSVANTTRYTHLKGLVPDSEGKIRINVRALDLGYMNTLILKKYNNGQ